jgi:hypothetical protein
MANLAHFPKSASYWTLNELNSYSIHVTYQDTLTFFEGELPPPVVDNEFLNFIDSAAAHGHATQSTICLLDSMETAMNIANGANEAAVNLFSLALLISMGYWNPTIRCLRLKSDLRF